MSLGSDNGWEGECEVGFDDTTHGIHKIITKLVYGCFLLLVSVPARNGQTVTQELSCGI